LPQTWDSAGRGPNRANGGAWVVVDSQWTVAGPWRRWDCALVGFSASNRDGGQKPHRCLVHVPVVHLAPGNCGHRREDSRRTDGCPRRRSCRRAKTWTSRRPEHGPLITKSGRQGDFFSIVHDVSELLMCVVSSGSFSNLYLPTTLLSSSPRSLPRPSSIPCLVTPTCRPLLTLFTHLFAPVPRS